MFTTIFSAIGETYLSDDDVLWWAKGGKLKGKSPERIAFLRELMESLPSAIEPFSDIKPARIIRSSLSLPALLNQKMMQVR